MLKGETVYKHFVQDCRSYFRQWYVPIFFEIGMRAGFSFISMRYSEVNNKYLTSYDPKKLTKYTK